MKIRVLVGGLFLLLLVPGLAGAIDNTRGSDPRVDYMDLTRFGPWDDRNYDLQLDDLALLPPGDETLRVAIPAFYRVELRRRFPGMSKSGPLQYAHSVKLAFMAAYDGFLVDGKLYSKAEFDGTRWSIDLDKPIAIRNEAGETESLMGDVQISSPSGGRESAIELSPINPDLAVAGAVIWPVGTRQEMFTSSDGGSSWSPAQSLPQGGALGDPTIAWSSDGQFVYTASLAFDLSTLFFYRSADNGQSWDDLANEPGGDSRREIGVSGSDKEFLHVDHSPTSPFKDRVYMTWDNFAQGNTMKFARSDDFGNSWQTTSFNSAPPGIAGDLTTDAAGTIYYLYPAFANRTIQLLTSTNGGASFSSAQTIANTNASFSFNVPSQNTRFVLVYVSADTDRSGGAFDGTVYASWSDEQPDGSGAYVQVAYSRDGGNSWEFSEPHSPDTAPDRYHQWLEVDDAGNVHVIYYDTVNDPSRTSVHVYHSVSTDGGVTWTSKRLTSESSPTPGDGFDFGDYNGVSITMSQLIAAFADNRDGSVDMWAAGTEIGGPAFGLAETVPGQAGVENEWTFDFGTPGGSHVILFGRAPGMTQVAQGSCIGISVAIADAKPLGFTTANGSGSGSVLRVVPEAIEGTTGFFQTLDLSNCQLSNRTTTAF